MWQVSTGLNLPQYPFLYHWQIRFTLPCIVLYSVYIAEWWASTCLLSVYAKDTIIWTDMQFLFSSSMLHTRSLNSQIYVVIFEFVPCSCHIYGWRLERGINLACIYSHLMFRWIQQVMSALCIFIWKVLFRPGMNLMLCLSRPDRCLSKLPATYCIKFERLKVWMFSFFCKKSIYRLALLSLRLYCCND
jgi:hypothetical protein